MTKYRVRYEIDLTVEADTSEEAIEAALLDVGDCDYYQENEITRSILKDADVEILEDTEY